MSIFTGFLSYLDQQITGEKLQKLLRYWVRSLFFVHDYKYFMGKMKSHKHARYWNDSLGWYSCLVIAPEKYQRVLTFKVQRWHPTRHPNLFPYWRPCSFCLVKREKLHIVNLLCYVPNWYFKYLDHRFNTVRGRANKNDAK